MKSWKRLIIFLDTRKKMQENRRSKNTTYSRHKKKKWTNTQEHKNVSVFQVFFDDSNDFREDSFLEDTRLQG